MTKVFAHRSNLLQASLTVKWPSRVRKFCVCTILCFISISSVSWAIEDWIDENIEKSVVRILNFASQPSWNSPWMFSSVVRSSGTGFVIEGQRIMTNAHVVSWSKQIRVWKYQDPQPYLARVEFVAHDADLAILTVDDPKFFEGVSPLEFGGLPRVRSTVVTYGYPAGGNQISYTEGVVSRIDAAPYSHIANRMFLTVQTDAAINPGNSGGPVVQNGQVVGVAFQGIPGLENTGFFIPTEVVHHVLEDVKDGVYDGFPDAGIRLVPLQNPAYRRWLGLEAEGLGVRVDGFLPIEETRRLLKVDDVLLKVGPWDVGNDGTILYEGNRVPVGVAFDLVQSGQNIRLEIWRDRQRQVVDLPVRVFTGDRRQGNQYDILPRYFVYGGLVFVPLSRDLLQTLGSNWANDASPEMIYQLFHAPEEEENPRSEPVVLALVLSHSVNADWRIRGFRLVDEVNGVRIDRLEDLIEVLWGETSKDRQWDHFRFIGGAVEAINREQVRKANAEILEQFNIPKDRRL